MDKIYAIALTFVKGVGPMIAKNLIAMYKVPEEIFREKPSVLRRLPRIGNNLADANIVKEAMLKAEREVEFARKNNVKIHYIMDESYPYRLRECADSPIVLYQLGNTNLNDGALLSVVGTRKPTQYGQEQTNIFIEKLSLNNKSIAIVSGLAYGIDSIAHKAALKHDLKTIAVVAHGMDRVYPALHKRLADKVIDSGGSIISEYPSETNPDAPNFVQRNRIIAGVSDATWVVESASKGGALLTASAANIYNREVFALPGRAYDIYSQGCNELIKNNKAQMVTSAEDILSSMSWGKLMKGKTQPVKENIILSDEEQKVVSILRQRESSVNELSRETGIPISQLVSMLVFLEFKGVVKAMPGSVYRA